MKPMHISQIINKQLGKNSLYVVIKNWRNIVGPIIFKIAVPIKIKKETLLVGVKTHQWLQELSFSKETMLQKISGYSKTITDVQFILRSEIKKMSVIKDEKKKAKMESISKALTEKDVLFIQNAIVDFKDNDLKDIFENILKIKLSNKPAKNN